MKYILRLTFILMFFSSGCTKYLDAVPDKSLTVPTNVADYQALLENELMFAYSPALGEFSTDDLYLPDALWATQTDFNRNAYIWSKDLDLGNTSSNWNYPYQKIYYANLVLESADKLRTSETSADIDFLKGWALFCRANALFDLQETFGQPYKPASAITDLGVPIKLTSNLKDKVNRSTVSLTFDRIIADLEQALPLLPKQVSITNRNRPSQAAAYALLARVYLIMEDYERALENATHSLNLYNKLTDYSTLVISSRFPFSPIIDEVIYNATQLNYSNRNWQVKQDFYQQFTDNDLRKGLFFTEDPIAKTVIFKGFYAATPSAFSGFTTSELYLIKAECEARAGHNDLALADLNTLLIKRFKPGAYSLFSTASVTDVLQLVLTERRKDCVFRGLRWSDLRRLNQDPRFAKTLTRVVNEVSYQLPPNDPRYTMPIPNDEIRINGIQQNIR